MVVKVWLSWESLLTGRETKDLFIFDNREEADAFIDNCPKNTLEWEIQEEKGELKHGSD